MYTTRSVFLLRPFPFQGARGRLRARERRSTRQLASTRVTDLVRGVLLHLGRSSGVLVLENDKFNVRATHVLARQWVLEKYGVSMCIECIGHGRERHASKRLGRHVVAGRGMNLDSLLPVRKRVERDRVGRKVVHGLLFPRDGIFVRFVLGVVAIVIAAVVVAPIFTVRSVFVSTLSSGFSKSTYATLSPRHSPTDWVGIPIGVVFVPVRVSPIRGVMTVLNAVPERISSVGEAIGSKVHVNERVDVLISRHATQMASKDSFHFSHARVGGIIE